MGSRPLNRAWRLLSTGPGTGAENMALDEALSESVRAGDAPFLRFYTWTPATLSLGRFQNTSDGLTEAARLVPRVRRSTGGGAIWHSVELTYSLGCTQDDLGDLGVKASFERLAGFLLDTWRSLGWDALFAKDAVAGPGTLGAFTPACFAGTELYDVVVGGRKLGGNAQRRDRRVVFQHGSIPLTLDHDALASLFLPGFRPDPKTVTDLVACGWAGSLTELTDRLVQSFQNRLDAELTECRPTDAELRAAKRLATDRYGNPHWTSHGGGSLRGD